MYNFFYKVVVKTKHSDDEQYIWESSAGGVFTVRPDTEGPSLIRGTEITLFLKDDCKHFSEEKTIKDLIKKHSQFISFPIILQVIKEKEREIENSDSKSKEKSENDKINE